MLAGEGIQRTYLWRMRVRNMQMSSLEYTKYLKPQTYYPTGL